jgi:hypothetical protein
VFRLTGRQDAAPTGFGRSIKAFRCRFRLSSGVSAFDDLAESFFCCSSLTLAVFRPFPVKEGFGFQRLILTPRDDGTLAVGPAILKLLRAIRSGAPRLLRLFP